MMKEYYELHKEEEDIFSVILKRKFITVRKINLRDHKIVRIQFNLTKSKIVCILYSINNELVSSDIVGTSAPSIYDSNATIVAKNGKSAVLYVWYDNEYGYSRQVMRLAKHLAEVRRPMNY